MTQTNRRGFFAALAGMLGFGTHAPALTIPQAADLLQSFDARDWARAFVAFVKVSPAIPLDETTMTTWFANALMRGYDERSRDVDAEVRAAGKSRLEHLTAESIRQTVAQGWCHPMNAHKEMDCNLALAISERLMDLRG